MLIREEIEQFLLRNGFEKMSYNIDGSTVTYYRRNTVQLLERHVLIMDHNDIYNEYDPNRIQPNVVRSFMWFEVGPVIERILEKHLLGSIW